MRHLTSDIAQNVTEKIIQEYRQEGMQVFFRLVHCILDGQVVGLRAYDSSDRLMRETPLENGQKHGGEYTWDQEGHVESEESYVNGQLYGLARQYNRDRKSMSF